MEVPKASFLRGSQGRGEARAAENNGGGGERRKISFGRLVPLKDLRREHTNLCSSHSFSTLNSSVRISDLSRFQISPRLTVTTHRAKPTLQRVNSFEAEYGSISLLRKTEGVRRINGVVGRKIWTAEGTNVVISIASKLQVRQTPLSSRTPLIPQKSSSLPHLSVINFQYSGLEPKKRQLWRET